MAGSTRDAKLVLSVEALGQENLTKLEKSLRDLATTGGTGAAEFSDLADAVARIGDQTSAVQALKQLTTEAERLSDAQAQAAERADKLAAQQRDLAAATEAARTKQEAAKQAYLDGQKAAEDAAQALRVLKTEYDAAGRNTDEYRTKQRALLNAQAEARKALLDLRDAQRAATAEANEAAAAQAKQQAQADRAAAAVDRATKAVQDQAKALTEAKQAAQTLAVGTDDIAASEAALVATFNRGVTAVEARRAAVAEMAEADRLAATEAEAMNRLYAQGEAALQAETLAQRDAVRAIQAYEAAKARATGDAAAWQREADAIVSMKEAERQTVAQTEKLVDKLREVKATDAFQKQAADAAQLLKAAEYVRFWEQALTEADQKQRQLAANADNLRNAFTTINIRPLEEVKAEIDQVNAAMNLLQTEGKLTGGALNTAFAQGQARINALQREVRELTGTLTLADRAADLFKNSMGQITAGNLVADGIGYLVNKVKEAGVAFIAANTQFDSTRRVLTQVTGSTQGAAEKIAFLRQVAYDAGVSVDSITKSFVAFQASASAAGIASSEVDKLFQAVTVSAGKMGLSSDQVSRALEALGQMGSKGTVSLEELRQQLGDALPGSFAVAAKGLGLTTSELSKLVESGNLTVSQFFPAFRAGLEQTFGAANQPVQGLSASFGRLQSAITVLYQRAADSSALQALGSAADFLAKNLNTVVDTVYGVGKAFAALKLLDYVKQWALLKSSTADATAKLAEQTAATAANTAATAANTAAKEANAVASKAQAAASTAVVAQSGAAVTAVGLLSGAFGALRGAVSGAFTALGGLPALALLVITNVREIGTWLGETAAKWMGYGDAIAKAEAQQKKEAEAAAAAAAAREQAQLRADQAFQREVQSLTKSREALELRQKTVEESVKAEDIRAQNIERIAALYDNEAVASAAAVQAAQVRLAAQEQDTAARNTLIAAMQAELAKRQELVASNPQVSQAYKDETTKLAEKIAKTKEEQAASENTVRSLQIEKAAREIHSASLQDNSTKVAEYEARMKDAEVTLRDLIGMQNAGLPVSQALAAAEVNLATQTALYNKALQQKLSQMQAQSQLEQANLNLTQTKLQVELQQVNSLAEQARASGNYAQAMQYEIEAKRIQIEITRVQAEAKRAEAKATIEAATAELDALKASGSLTEAKRLEIEARIANAKAKAVEAGASDSVIKSLEMEIAEIERRNAAVAGAIGSNQQLADSSILAAGAISQQAAATKQLTEEEENLRRGRTKDGYGVNTQGQKVVAGGDLTTLTGIYNFLKSAGVNDEAQAKAIAKDFTDAQGNVTFFNNPGQAKYGGSTISAALLRAAEQYTFYGQSNGTETQIPLTRQGSSASTGTADTTGSTTTTNKTVTINIGGKTQTIGVQSESDANNLVSILRQLEAQGSTAA